MPGINFTRAWGVFNGKLWPNTFDTRRDAIRYLENELGMTWKQIQRDKRIEKIRIVKVDIVQTGCAAVYAAKKLPAAPRMSRLTASRPRLSA